MLASYEFFFSFYKNFLYLQTQKIVFIQVRRIRMEVILKLISGLCWSIVYIVLIYNGFRHKNYGMPFVALSLNIAWEFIYSFHDFDIHTISLQRGINIFWLVLDFLIVYQYFIYGKKYFENKFSSKLFLPWSLLVFVSCFIIEFAFLKEFPDGQGAKYAAFLQNLVMSILFIDMLLKRKNESEFSITVAIAKFFGTLAPTILFGMENRFILTIGLLCAVFDMCYIGLVYHLKFDKKIA
jgi:hypothetical protein